jgi:hypothetical protein
MQLEYGKKYNNQGSLALQHMLEALGGFQVRYLEYRNKFIIFQYITYMTFIIYPL